MDIQSVISQQVANNLKMERLKQRLTQQQLAERMGVSHTEISRLESGKINVGVNTLERWAHGLGADLEVKLHYPE